MKTELRTIPYVGEATEASLLSLGYTTIASLKGADPQEPVSYTHLDVYKRQQRAF